MGYPCLVNPECNRSKASPDESVMQSTTGWHSASFYERESEISAVTALPTLVKLTQQRLRVTECNAHAKACKRSPASG